MARLCHCPCRAYVSAATAFIANSTHIATASCITAPCRIPACSRGRGAPHQPQPRECLARSAPAVQSFVCRQLIISLTPFPSLCYPLYR